MKLAKAIREARIAAGLSQAALAEKLDVSKSTVAGWELGTHSVRLAKIARLAKVMRVSVATLFEAA